MKTSEIKNKIISQKLLRNIRIRRSTSIANICDSDDVIDTQKMFEGNSLTKKSNKNIFAVHFVNFSFMCFTTSLNLTADAHYYCGYQTRTCQQLYCVQVHLFNQFSLRSHQNSLRQTSKTPKTEIFRSHSSNLLLDKRLSREKNELIISKLALVSY